MFTMAFFKLPITIFFALILLNADVYGKNITEYLSCFFHNSLNKSCPYKDLSLVERFSNLATSFPNSSRNLIKSENLSTSTIDELQSLYPLFFYFIPSEKLREIPENSIIDLLKIHKDDVLLALQLISSLDVNGFNRILKELVKKEAISNEVWLELLKYGVTQNAYDVIKDLDLSVASHLVLFLPPEFLLQLSGEQIAKYTYYLRTFSDVSNVSKIWSEKQFLFLKMWATIFVREQCLGPLESLNINLFSKFHFIMFAMNLQELRRMNWSNGDKDALSLHWDPIQFRMIFDEMTKGNIVSKISTEVLERSIFKFLPRQYKQLTSKTVSEMKSVITGEFIDNASLSLPTGIQLFELLVAADTNKNVTSVKLNNEGLLSIGKLLYTRSLLNLSQFCKRPLSNEILLQLDSNKITRAQAHYITGCGQTLRKMSLNDLNIFKNFLKTVPASYFINIESKLVKSSTWKHLLNHLPEGNVVLSAAVLESVRPYLGDKNYLSDLLKNPSNEFFSIISPTETSYHLDSIRKNLIFEKKNFEARIGSLPYHILMPLMYKEDGILWEDMYGLNQYNLFINGLTCDVILSIPSTDFMPILSLYNRKRKQLKKDFPKGLQRCVQNAVFSYLLLKARLQKGRFYTKNLLSYMDLTDIKIIGGYVLSTFSVENIFTSVYSRQIVSEIGSLSLTELMIAMPKWHIENIVFAYIEHHTTKQLSSHIINPIGVGNLLELGNLTHFIPAEFMQYIDAIAFRFIIESKYIDSRICADMETRGAWSKLLLRTFGEPSTWESDTLLSLNDMLIVLSVADLKSINSSSRLNSADWMTSSYHEKISSNSTSAQPFYEICTSTLANEEEASSYLNAVSGLIKYHLLSIQNLLDTILSSKELVDWRNYTAVSTDDQQENSHRAWKENDHFYNTSYSPKLQRILLEITEQNYSSDDHRTKDNISNGEERYTDATDKENVSLSENRTAIEENSDNKPSTSFKILSSVRSESKSENNESITDHHSAETVIGRSATTSGTDENKSDDSAILPSSTAEIGDGNTDQIEATTTVERFSIENSRPTLELVDSESLISESSANNHHSENVTDSAGTVSPDLSEMIRNIVANEMLSSSTETTKMFANQSTTTAETKTGNFVADFFDLFPFGNLNKNLEDDPIGNRSAGVSSSTADLSENISLAVSEKDEEESIAPPLNTEQSPVKSDSGESMMVVVERNGTAKNEGNTVYDSLNENSNASFVSTPAEYVNDETDASSATVETTNRTSSYYYQALTETTKNADSLPNARYSEQHNNRQFILSASDNDDGNANAEFISSLPTPTISGPFFPPENVKNKELEASLGKVADRKSGIPVVSSNNITDGLSASEITEPKLNNKGENLKTDNKTVSDYCTDNPVSSEYFSSNRSLETGNIASLETYSTDDANTLQGNFSETKAANADPSSLLAAAANTVKNYQNNVAESAVTNHLSSANNSAVSDNRQDQLNGEQIIKLLKLLLTNLADEAKKGQQKKKKVCPRKKKMVKFDRRKRQIIVNVINPELKISCNALRTLGPVSGLALEITDIAAMSSDEIFNCLDLFAKMNLTSHQKLLIWNSVKDTGLHHELGDIISVVNPNELDRFNFSIYHNWALEIIHLFSEYSDNNTSLHSAVVNKFLDENNNYLNRKRFPSAAMISLGGMICQLPSHLLRTQLDTRKQLYYVWSTFQRIKGCPSQCLDILADIAVELLGSPETWSSLDFHMLGPIPAGLKENIWLSLIQSNSTFTSRLSPLAVPCLSITVFQALNENQLSLLSPISVLSLTQEQRSVLSETQKNIIDNILSMKIDEQLMRITKRSPSSNGIITFASFKIIIPFLFIFIFI